MRKKLEMEIEKIIDRRIHFALNPFRDEFELFFPIYKNGCFLRNEKYTVSDISYMLLEYLDVQPERIPGKKVLKKSGGKK